jgi:hypothetical protein
LDYSLMPMKRDSFNTQIIDPNAHKMTRYSTVPTPPQKFPIRVYTELANAIPYVVALLVKGQIIVKP